MDRPSVLRLTPILFAIVFWVCSCSDNTGTTSGRSAKINYVAWPQKYYGDNANASQIPLMVDVAWTGTDTTSDWLWVDVSYRVDVDDEVPAAYDTLILGLRAAEQVPCTLKFSPTGGMLQRGFYRLRVGLCNDSDEVTRWDYAYDRASYNLYSGNDKFYLDVDVEYVAQNGMDFLKRNETRIGYIGHPYRHYPLGFIWYLQETEVSVEPILLSPSFFLDYKNRVASHWPSSPKF